MHAIYLLLNSYFNSNIKFKVGNRKIIWVAISKIYWLIVIQIKLFL